MASPRNNRSSETAEPPPFFTVPIVIRLLHGASVGIFFIACMMVPLVGRAAAMTAWYKKNIAIYSVLLLAGLAAAGGSLWLASRSKTSRKKLSQIMTGVFALMLILLAMGRFKL